MITTYLETSIGKWRILFFILICILCLSFCLSLLLGSVSIPLIYVFNFIIGDGNNPVWNTILLDFRIPKALTAILAGGALAVSGLQMQTLFRNPMAGPFILGISSGGGLGVALVIFLGLSFGGFLNLSGMTRSWAFVIASAAGSVLVLLIVLAASYRIKSSTSLLIIGLMFGSAVSALVSILQYFSQAENIQAYVIWTFGNLGSLSWSELFVMFPVLVLTFVMAISLSKPLNLLLLGDYYAKSMGMNLKKVRFAIILNTGLLAGTVTAFCGPLAFVGLAIPHITRMIFNTTNHLLLTPLVILTGSIFLLLFDIIAQLPGTENTLPINAVTSLFGAPFVIWLILKRANLNYDFK